MKIAALVMGAAIFYLRDGMTGLLAIHYGISTMSDVM